jgi:RAC serine/threonine-protein kinase
MSTRTKSGWLIKEGGSNKSWLKRFVWLDSRALAYYTKEDKKKQKGEILLSDVQGVGFVGDFGKHKYVFEIDTPGRLYHMKAPTKEESEDWVNTLKAILNHGKNPTPQPQTQTVSNGSGSGNLTTTNSTNNGTNNGTNNTNGTAPPTPKVGIDDFIKLKVVGKGAFGKVYLVKKKDNDQVFAMKMLNKKEIRDRDEIEHTLAEKSVLSKVKHPFLAGLYYSFQSDNNLYFVMDFINGGELFHHLSIEGSFHEDRAKFYAAEILLGLEYLHNTGVIYRDLKPENLLLNYQGHVIITDFGLSKEGLDKSKTTKTFCGTPEYLAPEIIKGEDYTFAVDWWSLGTLLFEMINGLPPFYVSDNEELMYEKILYAPLEIPDTFSDDAKDLISKLLDRDPNLRLKDPSLIKRHPFFRGLDFEKLEKKEVPPPFVPDVQSPDDVGNIDSEFLEESIGSDDEKKKTKDKDSENFIGFTFQKQPQQQVKTN